MQQIKESIRVHIRWKIRRDMGEVLDIEKQSSDHPWLEDDMLHFLREKNSHIGQVAEAGEKVVGFMLYELHKYKMQLVKLAVHPEYRRQGVGTQLINKLKSKIAHSEYRKRIVYEARETNLSAQLFLKSQGFICNGILCDHFPDSGEDGYMMVHKREEREDDE